MLFIDKDNKNNSSIINNSAAKQLSYMISLNPQPHEVKLCCPI